MRHRIAMNVMRCWRSSFVSVLLLVLVAASTQCAMQCAAMPCHTGPQALCQEANPPLPPCHRHSLPKHPSSGPSCPYWLALQEKAAPGFEIPSFSEQASFEFTTLPVALAFEPVSFTIFFDTSPPPLPDLNALTVLRI